MSRKSIFYSVSASALLLVAGITFTDIAKADTVNDQATSEQVTAGDQPVVDSSSTSGQDVVATDESVDTTSSEDSSSISDFADGVKDQVVDDATQKVEAIPGDFVGNKVVAPIVSGALSAVHPVSNVYAGVAGGLVPSSNAAGRLVADTQTIVSDIKNTSLITKLGFTALESAIPPLGVISKIGGLSIWSSVAANGYGLLTGKNDLIPDYVGSKVSESVTDSIFGDDTEVAKAATTKDTSIYTDKAVSGIVSVVNSTEIYDGAQEATGKTVAKDSAWKVSDLRVFNTSGQAYYEIGENQFVPAQNVVFS
ncbi:hypothetical protein [Lactobacillus terrae]|uniref:hypothetical protein n=1 Tax=Lactobacillus terrae TaxID=2269374 RepID=UPI000C1B7AEE|nr:hypothetical protein [Lactobacillus terrae]